MAGVDAAPAAAAGRPVQAVPFIARRPGTVIAGDPLSRDTLVWLEKRG